MINHLRHAPVSNDATALTQTQVDIVIARLQLRNALLGGLMCASRIPVEITEVSSESPRIRSG
jgi:hypothetical protein